MKNQVTVTENKPASTSTVEEITVVNLAHYVVQYCSALKKSYPNAAELHLLLEATDILARAKSSKIAAMAILAVTASGIGVSTKINLAILEDDYSHLRAAIDMGLSIAYLVAGASDSFELCMYNPVAVAAVKAAFELTI